MYESNKLMVDLHKAYLTKPYNIKYLTTTTFEACNSINFVKLQACESFSFVRYLPFVYQLSPLLQIKCCLDPTSC